MKKLTLALSIERWEQPPNIDYIFIHTKNRETIVVNACDVLHMGISEIAPSGERVHRKIQRVK